MYCSSGPPFPPSVLPHNLLRDCVTHTQTYVPTCVWVCVCVSLLLLATTCKSQIMTHTPTWGITKKGAGRRTGRKKKKTNLALAFCTFKKFKQCVSVFLEKLFVHWWRIHLHTHKHTHTRTLCALAASLEIQTETSFSHFIPYATHIHNQHKHRRNRPYTHTHSGTAQFLPFPFY